MTLSAGVAVSDLAEWAKAIRDTPKPKAPDVHLVTSKEGQSYIVRFVTGEWLMLEACEFEAGRWNASYVRPHFHYGDVYRECLETFNRGRAVDFLMDIYRRTIRR
jgi:hypothetical protein